MLIWRLQQLKVRQTDKNGPRQTRWDTQTEAQTDDKVVAAFLRSISASRKKVLSLN
jgi:hypothetical protein